MQRAIFREATPIHFNSQATRLLPGHGTGVAEQAVNDDSYHDGSFLSVVLSVLANVVGGALLFFGLFALPHVIMGILS